jgi:hypothetical protein
MTGTIDRVPPHTAADANQQIRDRTGERVQFFAAHPDRVPQRLSELDHAWDMARAIEANASALAFAGVSLGAAADRRWLILPAPVTAFLFQHAIQGWCPPVLVASRPGFCAAHDIEQERHAIKAISGDFESVSKSYSKPAAALRALAA